MNGLFEIARDVQSFCEAQGWKFCFIGGIAVQRWAEPRVTRDVDITLLTGFGNERVFIEKLLTRYQPRLSGVVDFALQKRILLLNSAEGVGIDVSLGALPFEEEAIRRSSTFDFAPGIELLTCSAEDLIVMKLFASRPLDIRDAEGVAIRHKHELDWGYIEEQLKPFSEASDEPEMMKSLARIRSI